MDIRTLKNYLRLTKNLNYRKTSEEVFIAQPALSRQIQQLEETIGAMLFDRDKRNVRPTAAGLFFQKEVERIVFQWEEACRKTAQIHRGEAGEVRIGHASSAMQSILPQLLLRFRQQMPDLHTVLTETANLFLIEDILNRRLDLGFAPNILPPSGIEQRSVYQENFVLILPQNHTVDPENFTDLSLLKDEDFIIPPLWLGMGYVETVHQICRDYGGFIPKIIHESAYSASVLRLVEAGIGISIEPKSTLRGQNLQIKWAELSHITQKADMKMLWLAERTEELRPILQLVESSIPNTLA
ncbi:LysR family transcriptional regulator [Runella sp.]|uniref:LysR family transcriptional regulator n=1 Tax=Runella sp. TaxID=1960881 RepID=UPI003D119816